MSSKNNQSSRQYIQNYRQYTYNKYGYRKSNYPNYYQNRQSNQISQKQFNKNTDSQLVCLDTNNQYVLTQTTESDRYFVFLASSESYVTKIMKCMVQSNVPFYYGYFDITPQIAQKFKFYPEDQMPDVNTFMYTQLNDYVTKSKIPGVYECTNKKQVAEIKVLLQQQSNGQLVNLSSNNYIYSKILQLYKSKASDYMQDVIQNGSVGDEFLKYYQNDKMLVVMPTQPLQTANELNGSQQWSIQFKRTYYIRKQDISSSATVVNVDQNQDNNEDQNAVNTQGNQNIDDDELSRGYLLKTGAEVGDIISNNNGIVIDSSCYDQNEGALSATAIIDLQPAPQDTELINHENETAASNAFVEVAGQQISGVQNVNKVNIGPNWQEIPDSGVAQCVCAADIVQSYTYSGTNLGTVLKQPSYDIASLYINNTIGSGYTYGDSTTALVQLVVSTDGTTYTIQCSTLAGTLTFYQKEQIISYLNHQTMSSYPYVNVMYFFPAVLTQIENAYVVAVEAGKTWKKIKTGLHKATKWIGGKIKGVFKVAPKLIKGISPLLPGPIGTVANVIGSGIDSITSVINARSVATSANNVLSVSDYQTDEDVFVCTPQYRVTDAPTADITQGTDWIDGESFQVPVLESGSLVHKSYACKHIVKEHPLIKQIVSGRLTAADGVAVQQRLKIKFLKHCTRSVANAYKAGLIIGSDTYCN